MSYHDMPVPPDFEPPKYAQQDEYKPVDLFDISADQKRLAQPTTLRPHNPFVLLALWLSLLNVFVVGFTLIFLLASHAFLSGLFWVAAVLAGAIWGVPALISAFIGLYQLSFTGFEKGKGYAWFSIVLGVAGLVVAVIGAVEIVHILIQVGVYAEQLQGVLRQFSGADLSKLGTLSR